MYTDVQGELTVGGVFLRLFVANPGWVLRKPKEFLTDLLEKWSELVSQASPNVSAAVHSGDSGRDSCKQTTLNLMNLIVGFSSFVMDITFRPGLWHILCMALWYFIKYKPSLH